MPNGGYWPHGPINAHNRPYNYRFTWTDGFYIWENRCQPSPVCSDDSEEAVENKTDYWVDYFRKEIITSLKEYRLLPRKLRTHKVISRIASFLGTKFDILSDDVIASSTPPGSALPGLPPAV